MGFRCKASRKHVHLIPLHQTNEARLGVVLIQGDHEPRTATGIKCSHHSDLITAQKSNPDEHRQANENLLQQKLKFLKHRQQSDFMTLKKTHTSPYQQAPSNHGTKRQTSAMSGIFYSSPSRSRLFDTQHTLTVVRRCHLQFTPKNPRHAGHAAKPRSKSNAFDSHLSFSKQSLCSL